MRRAQGQAAQGCALIMERSLILLVGGFVWVREHMPVVGVLVSALLGYQLLKGVPDVPHTTGLAPDPIVTAALPSPGGHSMTAEEPPEADPVLAFIQALALPGVQMPATQGGADLGAAETDSISERCMALRANAATMGTVTASQGDFTLDDNAVQLRCLMTLQVERRFCSEEVRGLVARHYALYAERIDALRARAAGKGKGQGDVVARWREVAQSPLHTGVTGELADLIFGGYIDQSYFGNRQSPSIQALFAHVTAIPDPCFRLRAENGAIEAAARGGSPAGRRR